MDAVVIKATPIDLHGETKTGDAFRQIAEACLYHATVNVTLIRHHDADALHQTRVGLRRLRSSLSLFRKQISKPSRDPMVAEVRALGRMLGPIRDLDVFLMETLPALPHVDKSQTESLRTKATALRLAAYNQIEYERWTRLIDQLHGLTLTGRDLNEPISEAAPDLLHRQARKVKRCLRNLDTPEQRHALRKALKKLRYDVEFLGSLFPSKDVRNYLDHCKDAQEVLGKLNDAAATVHLLRDLHADHHLLDWAERQEAKAQEQHLGSVVRQFRSASGFWY